MQIQQLGGLPAHPLIVHLPVVLVPLAAVGALLMLVRPRWRHHLAIPTAVLATVAAIATQLAISSGEWLEHQVEHSDLIEEHSQIAEQARPWVFMFALIMIAVAVWDFVQRRKDTGESSRPGEPASVDAAMGQGAPSARSVSAVRSRAATVAVALTALGLVFGLVSTVEIYRTGHSGAKATWHDATTQSAGSEHDGDGG